MMKTNTERVYDFILLAGPEGVTNAQIRVGTGIEPHQQVFMITRDLIRRKKIHGHQMGREWIFYATETPPIPTEKPTLPLPISPSAVPAAQFETLTRQVFSQYFGKDLRRGKVPGVPKEFDLVSADGTIVGDAKYYTLVRGTNLPPAKFATIAEHVWLLEKTKAQHSFLVFGNQREVPLRWLKRYGHLAQSIHFYFMSERGEIEILFNPFENK